MVFGNENNSKFHYIENIVSGEINVVKHDRNNYLMTYAIAPKSQASFAMQTR